VHVESNSDAQGESVNTRWPITWPSTRSPLKGPFGTLSAGAYLINCKRVLARSRTDALALCIESLRVPASEQQQWVIAPGCGENLRIGDTAGRLWLTAILDEHTGWRLVMAPSHQRSRRQQWCCEDADRDQHVSIVNAANRDLRIAASQGQPILTRRHAAPEDHGWRIVTFHVC